MSTPTGLNEIVVRLVTAYQGTPDRSQTALFLAQIYSDKPLPFLTPADQFKQAQFFHQNRFGLTLTAIEQVMPGDDLYTLWRKHLETGGALDDLKAALRHSLSPGLLHLMTENAANTPDPLRLWWASRAGELADLPWELIAPRNLSFVRGALPDKTLPRVPLAGNLRLLLIGDPEKMPVGLAESLQKLTADMTIEIVVHSGGSREGLRRAASEGFEIVHLIGDGTVSSSLQGQLYLSDESQPECSAAEVSSLFAGSRVTLLSLSTTPNPQPDILTSRRGLALFGASPHDLPTVMTLLTRADECTHWTRVYTALNETLSLEKSVQIQDNDATPLFLAHRQQQTFERVAKPAAASDTSTSSDAALSIGTLIAEGMIPLPTIAEAMRTFSLDPNTDAEATGEAMPSTAPPIDEDPVAMNARLNVSSDLAEQLRAIQEQHRDLLPESVTNLIDKLDGQSKELQSKLSYWTEA